MPELSIQRILVVCTGNICRSPMGEALLQVALGSATQVQSAGTHALVGEPADADAVAVMAAKGLSLESHRARQVSLPLLREVDLVLVMQNRHSHEILSTDPTVKGKTFLFAQWLPLNEVEDPYLNGRSAFEHAARHLADAAKSWAERLAT